MKKNIYLTILTIITVICIIAGSCYHLLGWGLDWGLGLAENAVEYRDGWVIRTPEAEAVNISSDPHELGEFTSISADVNVMELRIVPGDTASIAYKSNASLAPQYEIVDGVLIITQKRIRNLWRMKGCEVTLTVPATTNFESIDIYSAVGDIDINGLSGKSLSLEADVGDIDVEGCSFGNVTISASVGDIDLDSSSFDTLDISSSVGDVDVDSSANLSDYTIKLDTSVGEVTVKGGNYRRSFSQEGSDAKRVNIENTTGDISLDY